MKNILLLVHEDKGQEARLQTALDLARALNGHIHCAEVTPLPVYPGDFDGSMAGMVVAEDIKTEASLRRRLDVRLAHEDVSFDWTDDLGDMALCLANQSRLTDLIIVNCKKDTFFEQDRRGLASDLVMSARCPIVAVPDAAVGLNVSGAAMIAWDGSEPAAAALRAAIPLLKLARSVHLVSVGQIVDGPSARAAAVYLSRHDIHAKVHLLDSVAQTPDVLLLRQAEIDRAAYCVMGAYGRGRLYETVFGGVTRRMIEAARIPLILSR
ncbi:universal stress protein [Caulobacter sp.]|uniref:universal stress protein n=1 Tax=Caulobacter sp. TaxID=78 RepID=UPI0025C2D517|nr:universal stress protein [Caulobacter sp.]MBQ1562341.1 universal stress protein [Caulobacter sp.]